MHSEWVSGLILRPMMDAGYTAWREGTRVGIVGYEDGELVVEADDLRVRTALVDRMVADLRAAGIMEPCESSSQGPRARSDAHSSGFFSTQDTKSAA